MTSAKLMIFFGVTVIAAIFSAHPGFFALTRQDLQAGEVWRLVTGHFVHFSRSHLLLNLGAFALLLHLLPRISRQQCFWLAVVTPLALSAALLLTRPQLDSYGGLSGCLSALFVFVALRQVRQRTLLTYVYVGAMVLFAAKTFIEMNQTVPLFASLNSGVVLEPAAHAIGSVLGIFAIFVDRFHVPVFLGAKTADGKNKKAVPEGTA